MKRKKTLESDAINHSNQLRHPAHDGRKGSSVLVIKMPDTNRRGQGGEEPACYVNPDQSYDQEGE